MKITKQIDRGIYVETWRRSESAEDIRAVFDGITESFNLTAELAKAEAAAMAVLRDVPRGPVVTIPPGIPEAVAAGLRDGVRLAHEAEARGERPPMFDVAKANPQQRDAADVIWELWLLRQAVASGDAAGAALRGYRLGRFFERMMVRSAEPSSLTGRKVRGGGRKGAALAREHLNRKRATHEVIFNAYCDLRRMEPTLSITAATTRIAEKFGWTAKTIGNIRRKFESRKRG